MKRYASHSTYSSYRSYRSARYIHPIIRTPSYVLKKCIPIYTCNHTCLIPRIKTRIQTYTRNHTHPILCMRTLYTHENANTKKGKTHAILCLTVPRTSKALWYGLHYKQVHHHVSHHEIKECMINPIA